MDADFFFWIIKYISLYSSYDYNNTINAQAKNLRMQNNKQSHGVKLNKGK